MVEIRSAVEKQTRMACRVPPGPNGAHGKVALHMILAQCDGNVIKRRRLRRPQVQLLWRQEGAAAAVLAGLALGDGIALIGV